MKNRVKIVIGAFCMSLLFAIGSANAIECSDDCGSINCPDASWCGITYNSDGTTTYDCEGGASATVFTC